MFLFVCFSLAVLLQILHCVFSGDWTHFQILKLFLKNTTAPFPVVGSTWISQSLLTQMHFQTVFMEEGRLQEVTWHRQWHLSAVCVSLQTEPELPCVNVFASIKEALEICFSTTFELMFIATAITTTQLDSWQFFLSRNKQFYTRGSSRLLW